MKAIYSRGESRMGRERETSIGRPTDSGRPRQSLVFPAIRKKMIGKNLKALICGSAPLTSETQLFFTMLGIRVLQVYGLT